MSSKIGKSGAKSSFLSKIRAWFWAKEPTSKVETAEELLRRLRKAVGEMTGERAVWREEEPKPPVRDGDGLLEGACFPLVLFGETNDLAFLEGCFLFPPAPLETTEEPSESDADPESLEMSTEMPSSSSESFIILKSKGLSAMKTAWVLVISVHSTFFVFPVKDNLEKTRERTACEA